jgi:cell wall assembly regulator SMI1
MPPNPEPVWRWTTEPLTEKMIRSAERDLGVEFPADYRACVREKHGGAPDPAGFRVPFAPDRREMHAVGLLLTLDPRESENVLQTRAELAGSGQLPDGVIPIINDGSGNYVCLDYRTDPARKSPSVVFLACERAPGADLIPLANSFAEFLSALHAEP